MNPPVHAGRSPMLFTPDEARASLRIGRTKFWAEVKAGRLRVVKLGAATRVPAEELDRYVASLPARAA
ncbi:helix-turn-helix domain-containing protein [Salinarimonas soli]|uniref:Helix-turn-helix domain-containing protein n=1 Tax=Salinarimonas soli TaxID=1638099 RepID=A0A5B2VPV6_9HYPH|nr:helix-turn-helix domain-containing protein [Salinarimonas soli]KAA2241161.1 helix-turn-helix domain-containing protein [Salinarimonas soli]